MHVSVRGAMIAFVVLAGAGVVAQQPTPPTPPPTGAPVQGPPPTGGVYFFCYHQYQRL